MIKQFSIFKAKDKKSPNSPDYNISLKINDKYATVGGCWIKEMKDGSKYFSCKLSDGYKDVKGFTIIREENTGVKETPSSTENINPDNIPF